MHRGGCRCIEEDVTPACLGCARIAHGHDERRGEFACETCGAVWYSAARNDEDLHEKECVP